MEYIRPFIFLMIWVALAITCIIIAAKTSPVPIWYAENPQPAKEAEKVQPVNKPVPAATKTRPVKEIKWSSWQEFEATAYTSHDAGCNHLTKTEYYLVPGSKVVAVDPKVIPLGSRVEIWGMGIYYAVDIGGAIKGKRIDLWYEELDDALEFGRRTIKLRWEEKWID